MSTQSDQNNTTDFQTGPGSVVDTFIELIETVPMDQISYEMISERSAVPVTELQSRFPSLLDLADAYFQKITDKVVDTYEKDGSDSYKDTLFDVLMSFFDELSDDRKAVKNMISNMWKNTYRLPQRHDRFIKNMGTLLDTSGIETKGLRGRARMHSLGVIFVMTVRKWMDDDTDDLAKTMAELDKHLSRAEEAEQKINECSPLKFMGA